MLFSVSDLHLPLGVDKPMNIFGSQWDNYVERIADNWQSSVGVNDVVVLPGDFSWATYLEQSVKDFEFLDKLNGKKILSKGNHDYWWTTASKMKAFTAKYGFNSVDFMHNNCFMYGKTALCGSRGWVHPAWQPFSAEDCKIFEREVIRAELSLKSAGDCKDIIYFNHYPVCSNKMESNKLTELLHRYNVKEVVYGHLHSKSARECSVNGKYGSIRYRLVSADYVNFTPQLLRTEDI